MKPKWKYDITNKEWWTSESGAWDNDAFSIKKSEYGRYVLARGIFRHVASFKKLSSAKKVAELIING